MATERTEKKFETELELKLWEMLYRSQTALAIECLKQRNLSRAEEREWPCGQGWNDLSGSSKAVFTREARLTAGIPDDGYLAILRKNHDAGDIAEEIAENIDEHGTEWLAGDPLRERLTAAIKELVPDVPPPGGNWAPPCIKPFYSEAEPQRIVVLAVLNSDDFLAELRVLVATGMVTTNQTVYHLHKNFVAQIKTILEKENLL